MSKMFHLDCEEEDYAMNGFLNFTKRNIMYLLK